MGLHKGYLGGLIRERSRIQKIINHVRHFYTWGKISSLSSSSSLYLSFAIAAVYRDIKGSSLSMHTKGLETPAHEPRANNLTALDYATTPRGAYHCYEPMHLSSYMNQKEEIGLTNQVDKYQDCRDT